jgi:transposase-like protein
MDKNYKIIKVHAIKLRKLGLSYGEISRKLRVSKSTLSFWLKEIELNSEQKKRLYTKQTFILNSGPQSRKNRRIKEVDAIIKSASAEIETPISLNTYRLFGTALYWAEGNKTQMFGMTNSDPNLILFWVSWLNKMFKISPASLKATLNIYPQQKEDGIGCGRLPNRLI